MYRKRSWSARAGTTAALLLTASLMPATWGGQADAASAKPSTTPSGASQAAAALQKAVSEGKTFDPSQSFQPGSAQQLQTSKTSDGLPATPGSAQPAPSANADGGSLGLSTAGSLETPQGLAETSALPNGDSVEIDSQGAISLVRPDGSAAWLRSTGSLYKDWQLSFQGAGSVVPTPQLLEGDDPVDPFDITAEREYAVDNTHNYAVGDLAGDGSTDIAVAEVVGTNLGLSSCNCAYPFNVPGSSLHLGTFVTVLDERTGATVYSRLEPGFVTQLAISGTHLIVGDETGSGQEIGEPGEFGLWDSQTSVQELAMHAGGDGELTATQDWSYSTGAQWGRLLGLQTIGSNVAVSWSDTPLGLGDPGPSDGHVVMLDEHGRVAWDQRTAGYPVLTQYDPSRGLLAVVEQNDPTGAISYRLDGLRPADGHTVTSTVVDDVIPTTLNFGALKPGGSDAWLVGGVTPVAGEVAPPEYNIASANVTAVDPSSGRTQWSATLADTSQNSLQPGSVSVVDGAHGAPEVLVGSWLGGQTPSAASALTEMNDLQALSGSTGTMLWDRSGDVANPLSLTVSGTTVRGVTAEQDAATYDLASGRTKSTVPLLGPLYTAVSADVRGDGALDEIAGGESGAVYAFDGDDLSSADGTPNVLWQAYVGGVIHQIVPTTVDGRRVLVVASTTGLATVDEQTGRVLHLMPLSGQYVWNVAVGTAGGRTVIVTAGDQVSAFDAATGAALWSYQPPVTGDFFADPAVVDGVVVTDYSNGSTSGGTVPATSMAAIGLDAASGKLKWSVAGDPSTTIDQQLTGGVIAGAGIPGAGADGAAFAWTTTDYQGRVDVRDAQTGALIYSDTSQNLAQHAGYLLSPTVGLLAIGQSGVFSVSPTGASGADFVQGNDIALAEAGGKPVLVTSSYGLDVYPLSAASEGSNYIQPLADLGTFMTGNVYVNADNQIIATDQDRTEQVVLQGEAGQFLPSSASAFQQGVVVASLTGTPAANAAIEKAPARASSAQPESRPATLPVADTAASNGRIAEVQPAAQLEIHGYTASGAAELTTPAPAGYSPALVQSYLGLHGNGAGQTVAVVDAPGNPDIAADVNLFSAQYGLPQECSATVTSDCFDFTVDTAAGSAAADPGWGLETSLDIEWIHAIAPQASITLVESQDGTVGSMFQAVAAAARLKPDAISMSWGTTGEFTDETYYDHFCQLSDSLCVASAGDYGFPGSYPAYNPAVLSIGGTSLQLGSDGSVQSETAWSSGGGGQSYVEPTPAYQSGVVTGGRGEPDVSFDADPATGVAIYDSSPIDGQSGWFVVGGTSVGAPVWSAILTTTDQLRAAAGQGPLNTVTAHQAVYGSASALGDITSGSNGQCPVCTAGTGYDFVTGLGSPRNGIDAALAAVK